MHKAQAHNLVEQSNNKLESGGGVRVWEAQDKAIKERKAGRQANTPITKLREVRQNVL